MATSIDRVGGFLKVVEENGCRHLISIRAIQLISDADPCRDETVMIVAGREIRLFQPLDEVVMEMMTV